MRGTSRAALGMPFGTTIGGGIGVLLFVFTQRAHFTAIAGMGTAVGLVVGAEADHSRKGPSA